MKTFTQEERDQLKRAAAYRVNAEHSPNGNGHAPNEPNPIVLNTDEIEPEDIDWVWPGRLAMGKITVLEGDPGLGKSTLTTEIAARLSRGQLLPDGLALPPVGTMILSAEDGVADTIVPRLISAGADRSRIKTLEGADRPGGDPGITIPRDLALIERAMTEHACEILIVDPISAYWDDGINENRNQDVRKALHPLKQMLERTHTCAMLLRHWTKAQTGNAIYRGQGSIALSAAARIVFMVAEDPEIPGLRVVAGVKGNLAADVPSLAYRLLPDPENPKIATIGWQGVSHWSKEDLQGSIEEDSEECTEWLADFLKDSPRTRQDCYREAAKMHFSERAMRRASQRLGVIKKPAEFKGPFLWTLPTKVPWD